MWSAAMDVGGWLRGLGLGQYEANFRDNKINADLLPRLRNDDLKDIGVTALGDRLQLLDAIAALAGAKPPSGFPPSPSKSVATKAPEVSAERRPITVMFCDLVGSTSLATKLDPEDWRNLVNAYLDEASGAVNRLGGHVLKRLGDGLMALFGYPRAQENDAERAVRAALAIQRALGEMNARNAAKGAPQLSARIGLESGPAVVEAAGEVFGDAPNIAARVQCLAEPGSVLATANVQRQTAGLFVAEDKGAHALKGLPAPITLYRIVRASGGRRAGARSLTSLVGRGEELELLRRRWERTRNGAGQLALIVGEPGIGKSRLVEEFRETLRETPHTYVEWSSSQLLQNTPLHPIADWGRQRFGADEPADRRLGDLENTLRLVGLDASEYAPLLAPLVDIPLPEERAAKLAPEELRRRQLAALVSWVLAGARSQAVAIAFEDLHWADPTSLDLMQALVERGAQAPLFILATARPEFRPPWSLLAHHSVISLSPLDRAHVARMVGELAWRWSEDVVQAVSERAGGVRLYVEDAQQLARKMAAHHSLSPQTMEALVTRTGGVPLFIEEITRSLVEGDGQAVMQAIPSTLQTLLTARLDRLGSAKEIAQVAAVLGREFSYPLIRAVAGQSDAMLSECLERLTEADLIRAEGMPPRSNYRFKHALMQDAAYETMLKSRRRELHRVVARTLGEEFKDTAEAQPELLAYHLTEAGANEEAIRNWQRAGQKAIERSANIEAISHFSNGLELVKLLPEGSPRDQLELDLRVAIGVPLIASRGYSAPEVEQTYARAREISERVGGSLQFANIVWGLWARYMTGGPIGAALELAEQYRAIAERTQESGHLLETCQVMGVALFYLGEFPRALPYLSRGGAMYDPERHHALVYEHGGGDTGVTIRTHEALVLWALGFPDQARQRMEIALHTANSLARHPFSVVLGHYVHAWLYKLFREEAVVEESTDVAMKISEDQGFPFFRLLSAALRGSALVARGATTEGVAATREALAVYQEIGGQVYVPELLGLLGVGLAEMGRLEEALKTIAEALQRAEKSQDRWWQAELHRVRGELTARLPGDHAAAAEAAFQEALDVARTHGAKSWELRAAVSLARLWRRGGKTARAQRLLRDVYGWFSEGFDTADLREAAMLLAELTDARSNRAGRSRKAGSRSA
jgi:class 3 adenylate cyclase/predicted ATPase